MDKWNVPILSQYASLEILDEDIETVKQRETDEARRDKELAKAIATETEEEKKKERQDREAREARLQAIRERMQAAVIEKVGSRITEADRQNNRHSLYRKLDSKLFLIVKKNRRENAWQFPQGPLLSNEMLRPAAERIFAEECNVKSPSLQSIFVGNGPLYFHTYKYPENLQKELNTYGAKVFFVYSYYLEGEVNIDNNHVIDYAWVTKTELKDYFTEDLWESINVSLPNNGSLETRKRDMPNHQTPPPPPKGKKKKAAK